MNKVYAALSAMLILVSSCAKKEEMQIPPQSIKVYDVVPKTVPIYNEFVGHIYGERDIPIRARVDGFLEKIHFREGSTVSKGDILYSIDPDEYTEQVVAAQSKVSEAQTMLVQAESDLQRIEPLAKIDAVSMRELDMARADRDASKSSLKAANANLNLAEINLGYTNIYAPSNGVIGKTAAREGEYVGKDPNPVILNTISEIKNIRVQFFLSENEYLIMAREFVNNPDRTGDKPEMELILSDGSVYEHKGEPDFIDRNIDESTGAILVQATFPNPRRIIRPGQFARVKIKIRDEEDALLVPQKCISELQGLYSVFVVNSQNKIEAKQVEIGEKIGDYWIVKSGIQSHDKVVLEGLQKVQSGMEVIPEVTAFESQINIQ